MPQRLSALNLVCEGSLSSRVFQILLPPPRPMPETGSAAAPDDRERRTRPANSIQHPSPRALERPGPSARVHRRRPALFLSREVRRPVSKRDRSRHAAVQCGGCCGGRVFSCVNACLGIWVSACFSASQKLKRSAQIGASVHPFTDGPIATKKPTFHQRCTSQRRT